LRTGASCWRFEPWRNHGTRFWREGSTEDVLPSLFFLPLSQRWREKKWAKRAFCYLYFTKWQYIIYDIIIFADYCKIIITYLIYWKIMLNFAMTKENINQLNLAATVQYGKRLWKLTKLHSSTRN
jgi:hypothetical protein